MGFFASVRQKLGDDFIWGIARYGHDRPIGKQGVDDAIDAFGPTSSRLGQVDLKILGLLDCLGLVALLAEGRAGGK